MTAYLNRKTGNIQPESLEEQAIERARELHGTLRGCTTRPGFCLYCKTEAAYRILEAADVAPLRHHPVRWQIVDGDSPTRSPVHRVHASQAQVTICGEEVPSGAWKGKAVERRALQRHKCPECWGWGES